MMFAHVWFQLANMAVTLFFIIYIVKKRVIPSLRHDYTHALRVRQDLFEHINDVNKKCDALNTAIDQEKQAIKVLQQSIEIWHMVEKKRVDAARELQESYQRHAEQKASDYLAMQQQKNEHTYIMNQAILSAVHILQNHFAQDTTGEKYNARIVNHMHERN